MEYSAMDHLTNTGKAYYELKALVMDMVKEIGDKNPSFTYPVAMGELDIVLQTVLFYSAIEDDKIVKAEKLIIKELTSYEDLLSIINQEQLDLDPNWQELDWTMVASMTKDEQKEIASLALEIASSYAKELVTALARADEENKRVNYLEKINKAVIEIIIAFCGIDGDNVESINAGSESYVGLVIYNELVNKRWLEITGEEQ